MTGEESRKLKSRDRVFWQDDVKNQGTVRVTSRGTVRVTSWSGITIDWDDDDSHNDMAQVPRTKL
jgi:hypothetical protein